MSGNDNNAKVTTVPLLFEEKLRNLKTCFAAHAQEHGFGEQLAKVTVEDVQAQLLAARLVWSVLEDADVPMIITFVEAAKTEENAADADRAIVALKALPAELRDLLPRYLKFFIHCLQAAQ